MEKRSLLQNKNLQKSWGWILMASLLLMAGFFVYRLKSILPKKQEAMINRDRALMMANQTDEAKAFSKMSVYLNKPQEDCLQVRVMESCHNPWVTCLDDGWVIEYGFKSECLISPSSVVESMKMLLVLDAKTGRFISKFPELSYLTDQSFCLEDNACRFLTTKVGSLKEGCLNFFYAGILNLPVAEQSLCSCVNQQCQ